AASVRRHGAELVRGSLADPESVFLGLRQPRGRISVRHVFTICECARRFGLVISVRLSTTGGCAFDRAPFCFGCRGIFACAGSRVCNSVIGFCCTGRLAQWLDPLLGGYRLVWCARGVHLAAMGVVGRGTRSGFAAIKMALPLAG